MTPETMLRRLVKIVPHDTQKQTFKAVLELGDWGSVVVCSGYSETMTQTHVSRFVSETATKVYSV